MPIYEYRCENGHVFDVMQKLSEDPLTACVECGAPVKKLLHPVNISFKGSGFYSTDYRSGSKKEKTESAKNGGQETKSPDNSKGEKKSESSGGRTKD